MVTIFLAPAAGCGRRKGFDTRSFDWLDDSIRELQGAGEQAFLEVLLFQSY
jgi:hypothetical protein